MKIRMFQRVVARRRDDGAGAMLAPVGHDGGIRSADATIRANIRAWRKSRPEWVRAQSALAVREDRRERRALDAIASKARALDAKSAASAADVREWGAKRPKWGGVQIPL